MLRASARHPDACLEASDSTSELTEAERAELFATLNEYLLLEPKFQPRLCLPTKSENGEEVTTGDRDGAAHVMRCLKVWFDLPVDVLVDAICLFDRFLTKMKVRPSHLPCITVACMNIAIEEYAAEHNVKRTVSIEELVSISQSTCTSGDVTRMSRVVADKLGVRGVTPLHWLRLLRRLLGSAQRWCPERGLTRLLEVAACDANCATSRTSALALVLLHHKLEERVQEWSEHAYYMYEFLRQVQEHCRMSDACLVSVRNRLRHVECQYEASEAQPQRQRLVWRLSERTLKVLRPTDRLTSLLPTIEEQQQLCAESSPVRNRSGSESSESEETCDWPQSPVLPVYCDN